MPKVELILKTILAGPEGNGYPGDKIFMDEKEAKDLVEGKYASYVEVIEVAAVEEVDDEFPEEIQVLPRGFFLLPNGEKVKGKENALAAYKVLVAEE